MNKKIVLMLSFVIVTLFLSTFSFGLTGYFSKVFTKTLSGEVYEKNITVRKYFNLTIRFQKENSTSYLTIRNDTATIILKDVDGNWLKTIIGMNGTAAYEIMDKLDLNKVFMVSAFNINSKTNWYEDVINQSVNISYYGTRATIIIKVNLKNKATANSMLAGYIFDDLTDSTLSGITLLAFEYNSIPETSDPIIENKTEDDGKYVLFFNNSFTGNKYDIYVKDYDVV